MEYIGTNFFQALQEIISKEQKEFLEFAKMKWNDSFNWLIKCNKFVTLKWKAKRQRFEKLPVLYVESLNIPLSVQEINFKIKDIKVTFTSCLRQVSYYDTIDIHCTQFKCVFNYMCTFILSFSGNLFEGGIAGTRSTICVELKP